MEEIKVLKNELKILKTKEKEWIEKNNLLWEEYDNMEGMYAIKKESDEVYSMGSRGFHYVYPDKETKLKEEREREKFLKDNNVIYYSPYSQPNTPFTEEIKKIKNEICLLKNGFDIETKNLLKRKENLFTEIEKLKKEIDEINIKLEN
jgi:hypothetical protein